MSTRLFIRTRMEERFKKEAGIAAALGKANREQAAQNNFVKAPLPADEPKPPFINHRPRQARRVWFVRP